MPMSGFHDAPYGAEQTDEWRRGSDCARIRSHASPASDAGLDASRSCAVMLFLVMPSTRAIGGAMQFCFDASSNLATLRACRRCGPRALCQRSGGCHRRLRDEAPTAPKAPALEANVFSTDSR